jgi:hypothetical protein
VLLHRGVLAVVRTSHVGRDPLAREEYFHGPPCDPRLNCGTGVTVGYRVKMARYFDMIVEANLAYAPLGKEIGLGWKVLEERRVDLVEKLATGAADVGWSVAASR